MDSKDLDKTIKEYNDAILRVVKAFRGGKPDEFREGLRMKEYEALRDLNVLRIDFGDAREG